MKIKTTKQMRLDELIKHIIENKITDTKFKTTDAPYWEVVEVNKSGVINVSNVSGNRRFKIQIEEEVTEETEFKELIIVQQGRIYHPQDYKTIKSSLESFHPLDKVFAYTGEDFTLIWSKDTDIPAEGVIEV